VVPVLAAASCGNAESVRVKIEVASVSVILLFRGNSSFRFGASTACAL
jgi:hypothetical protein